MGQIKQQDNCVAIIGMGCIFPKANGVEEYWHLLFDGHDAITDIPDKTHFAINDYFDEDPKRPDHIYCKKGGFLPAVSFDPSKYGIPPNNINATDTSQLLGLIVAEMALKDAGYDVQKNFPNKKRTNIILGVTGTQELVIPLGARLGHPLWKKALKESGIGVEKTNEVIKRIQNGYPEWQENSFPGLLGNVVAGRIANKLDLGGTNSVVDAACASSLSAINSAIMELVQGKCDMSITGGVDALNDIFMHMCFSQTGVLSHTSDAKPFSKDSDGTVLGEGVGMVVLKRLSDAKKDKDRIYAVIKGIGTSSDGNSGGIYAPDAAGQQRALQAAYKDANIDPLTIESIEAHGTGTRVGDKIEFQALKNFNSDANNKSKSLKQNAKPCAIGSVKSMIGHTKAAAGVAGLIKASLSLYHKTHFPTLKADIPDPELDINDSRFYLNSISKPWMQNNMKHKFVHPRRAGVSAFGFGGSNFHVVLEEYNQKKNHVSWSKSVQILAFSDQSLALLKKKITDFSAEIDGTQNLDSREQKQLLGFYAEQSRKTFSNKHKFRLILVHEKKDNLSELIQKASNIVSNNIKNNTEISANGPDIYFGTDSNTINRKNLKIGFLYPGQGSQYTMMGRDLISIFPEAMDALALADIAYGEKKDLKLLHDYIFPFPDHVQEKIISEQELKNTDIAQPALGAISLAMTKVLQRFNIICDMACGHSFGELSALNAANVINDNDFLNLSVLRGKHMANASKNSEDSGAMFAIKAPMDKIEQIINENNLELVLANKNSHTQGVISGASNEIDKAIKIFKKHKIRGIKLPVAAAFHSHLVGNAAKPFATDIKKIKFNSPKIPVMSNTNGNQYPADIEKIKKILENQLINPVNFIQNIETMYENGVSIFIETGPKTILTGLVQSILKNKKDIIAISMDASMGNKPDSGLKDLARVLAELASKGYNVDLGKWEDPCEKPEKKKMNIFITGANPKPEKKLDLPLPKIKDEIQKKDFNQGMNMDTRKNIDTSSRPYITNEAMVLVQKGLESMQKLQSQTAKTHEKFLETQAEASRTLQSMMEQTRLFLNPGSISNTNTNTDINFTPASTGTMELTPPVATKKTEPDLKTDITIPDPEVQITKTPDKAEHLVFEIISKLTGFPEEMLDGDMDIESDLGIDSIKRVEIISELEKALPSISSLTPETMSSLHTLKEICNIIDKTDTPGKETPEPSPEAPALSNTETLNDSYTSIPPSKTMDVLIDTISNLTGFPKEMLEGDMNLESDLGIDSIKRVEILSTLENKLPQIGTISSDEIAGFKTIDEISAYLDKNSGQNQKKNQNQKKTPDTVKAPSSQKLSRQIPFLDQQPLDKIKFYNGSRISISKEKKVYLTKDSQGIAASFKKAFEKQGINAELIKANSPVPELHDVAGIVLIPDISETNNHEQTEEFLKYSFKLIKKNAPFLTQSALEKSGFFASISFLGGGFGFDKSEIINPVQGGLAGLVKTAGLEWKDILCKAIDLPCSKKQIIENADDIITLIMTHGSMEIGLKEGLCNIPKLKTEDIPHFSDHNHGKNLISNKDLFVITGGAKGVTAECAIELAKNFSPDIMLIGRSPLPEPEPEWAENITSPVEIKKLILKNIFADKKPTPKELEKAYKELISNREIKQNMEKIQNTAPDSKLEYFSCDITNKNQINNIFNIIREKYGRITGIIHGAGILEDKLIIEKDYDKFSRVFDTKVSGLNSLIHAGKKDKLKYFIAFSSIAARTGNIGQSDYSMANEVINKTMKYLSLKNTQCKYLAINWGPWDGGMVNDSLKKEFKKRNVDLIDKKAGAIQLLSEMANNNSNNVEVIIGAGLFGDEVKPQSKNLTRAFNYNLNGLSAPVLRSHKINNNLVLPFAMHMEWLAHAAEKNNPGLYFQGIDQMRLLKGISLPENSSDNDNGVEISAKTGKCKKTDQGFETEASIFSKKGIEKTFLNSAGIALLSDDLPNPPVLSSSSFLDLAPYPLDSDRIYDLILFHGKDLQGIKSVIGCSEKGIEIIANKAPAPNQWFKNPPCQNWIFDPMLLDSAFQAAILWTHENKHQVCLPSYITNFRLYNSFSNYDGDVKIRFTINETSEHKTRGYFTFLGDNNIILASITGFEAINDPSLLKKFKKTNELISKEQILAFAQGNPSEAFGEKYKIFDNERQMARLPRPPYFFMDRVTKINHTQWEMKPGGWIEAEYDVPEHGWYFNANFSDTIPFCILLEIALQPCGWLAAWAGSALQSNDRLYFRNLGGKAKIFKEIHRTIGTIKMRSRITDVSKAGGMIIQDFDIEVLNNESMIYKGSTNFGFFSGVSLANQVGLKQNKFAIYEIDPDMVDKSKLTKFKDTPPITPEDTNFDKKDKDMPSTALMMIDQVEQFSFKGGLYNKGYIKAKKQVNPDEWFFKAHFYQDPVCPGSLGIESFLQLLKYFALQKWEFSSKKYRIENTTNANHEWKYRGQIIPSNKTISICAHIKDIIDEDQPQIVADGALSVDGICIYEMTDFTISLVQVVHPETLTAKQQTV